MAGSPGRPAALTPALIVPILYQLGNENKSVRDKAGEKLVQGRAIPGYLPSLIQVASKKDMDVTVRTQAAIAVGECCKKLWAETDPRSMKIAASDLDTVRRNIIPATLGINEFYIVRLLGGGVAEIFLNDYQTHPAASVMPEQIRDGIMSRDSTRIRNSALVWFDMCKHYSTKGYDGPERRAMPDFKRGPADPTRSKFDKGIEVVNPVLLRLAQSAYSAMSPDSWLVLRYCIKAFRRSTQSTVSGPYLTPEGCKDWLQLCVRICKLPLPEPGEPGTPSGQPTDPAARRHWPFWKAKKWALRTGVHFMNRFGSGPDIIRYDVHKAFMKPVENVIGPAFTESALGLLARRGNGKFLPERLQTFCLEAVRQGTAPEKTWSMIKPALPMIMTKFLPAAIGFSGDAADLWKEDPLRYVSEIVSEDATTQIDRVSIAVTIKAMLRMRGGYIAPLMLNWVIGQFKQVKSMPVGGPQAVRLVSLLGYVDILAEYLVKYRKKYAATTEPVLTMGIMPCIRHPAPFVRAHACNTFASYAGFPWKPEPLATGTTAVLGLLDDKELAVRLAAVIGLRALTRVKRGADIIRPHAVRVVGVVIMAMQKMPVNDDVVDTLVALIRRFSTEVQPKALDLMKMLVSSSRRFMARAASGRDDDREADIAEMAQERAIQAMTKLIRGMPVDSPVVPALEREIAPMVSMLLRYDGYAMEFADVASDIVMSMVTRHTTETMTPACLALVDDLILAVINFLPDYIEIISKVIRPLAARAPWAVAAAPSTQAGKTRLQLLWECVQKVSNVSIEDCGQAMRVIQYVIGVGRGHCDDFVRSALLPKAISMMSKADAHPKIKSIFSGVASACFLYNPTMALESMEKSKSTLLWVQCMSKMIDPDAFASHDTMKTNTIALARLLTMVPKAPPSVMQQLPRVFGTLVSMVEFKMEQGEHEDADAEVERAGGVPGGYEEDAEGDDEKAAGGDAPDPLDAEHAALLKEAREMLGMGGGGSGVALASIERAGDSDEEQEEEGTEFGQASVDYVKWGDGDTEGNAFDADLDPILMATEFDMDYIDFNGHKPACDLFEVEPVFRTCNLLAMQACMSNLRQMGPDRMRALVSTLPEGQRSHLDEYAEMAEQRRADCDKSALGQLARGVMGPDGGLAPFQASRPSKPPPAPAKIPTFDIETYLKEGRIVPPKGPVDDHGGVSFS